MRSVFWLLCGVISLQLLVASSIVVSFIYRHNNECAKGRVADAFDSIAAQTFALYAAENATRQRLNKRR